MISTLWTPFCSDTTAVSGPTAGRARSSTPSVSFAFTLRKTASTGAAPISSSTAVALTTHSPSVAERTRSPLARIAAR